jgi:hypothetical protein
MRNHRWTIIGAILGAPSFHISFAISDYLFPHISRLFPPPIITAIIILIAGAAIGGRTAYHFSKSQNTTPKEVRADAIPLLLLPAWLSIKSFAEHNWVPVFFYRTLIGCLPFLICGCALLLYKRQLSQKL